MFFFFSSLFKICVAFVLLFFALFWGFVFWNLGLRFWGYRVFAVRQNTQMLILELVLLMQVRGNSSLMYIHLSIQCFLCVLVMAIAFGFGRTIGLVTIVSFNFVRNPKD